MGKELFSMIIREKTEEKIILNKGKEPFSMIIRKKTGEKIILNKGNQLFSMIFGFVCHMKSND